MTPRFCSLECWLEYVEACAEYGWQEMLLAYPSHQGHCCKCAQQLDTHPIMWILAQKRMSMSYLGFSARLIASLGEVLIIAVRSQDAEWQRMRLASGMQLQDTVAHPDFATAYAAALMITNIDTHRKDHSHANA